MKEKKFNYFYKITNIINGKYYYGVHSTNDLNDGYMGSGTTLHKAYKKYGVENFTKEILKFFEDSKSMFDYEKTIVNEELVKNENCYNLKTGGINDFVYSDESIENNKTSNIINGLLTFGYTPGGCARKNKEPWNKNKPWCAEVKQKIKEAALKRECSGSKDYKWTDEQKAKLKHPKSEQAKQNMRHPHKNAKKHWKLVDGKRVYYN